MTDRPRFGWESNFGDFHEAKPKLIRERLRSFIVDASAEQVRAWDDAIPSLQGEVSKALIRDELAERYSAILEYELPMESRRPDVILLIGAAVMVIELKGKLYPSQAVRPRPMRATSVTIIASAMDGRSPQCWCRRERSDISRRLTACM